MSSASVAAQTPEADSGLRNPARPDSRHPLQGRHARRTLRGGAPGGGRRDRQDPHHRVDAATALRRAPVSRHERQLERTARRSAGRQQSGGRCAGADRDAGFRQVHRRQEGRPVVFGFRLRPRYFRPGQPGLRRRPGVRHPRQEQEGHLGHTQSGPRQRRRESLRVAVQFPRGVRHGLPPARAGAGPDRIPRPAEGRQPDSEQDSRDRDVPGQGHRRHAFARAGQLGAQHGTPAAGTAGAAKSSALPAKPEDGTPGERHAADRCRGARSDPRPRARSAAIQRIPPPVRSAPVDQLRRFHRRARSVRRTRRTWRNCCARSTGSTPATPPR